MSNPDLDILKVGFEGQLAFNRENFTRCKVSSDGEKIFWNKFGLFGNAQNSIYIADINDI